MIDLCHVRKPEGDRRSRPRRGRRPPDILGVYLFGSRANGDAREDSDVDLGVLFDHRATLDERVDLETAFERALGCKVDVVDVGHCDPFLALDVIRGERHWEGGGLRCDHFDLYVMRRAGDLAPYERERRRMLLTPERP